MRLNFIVWLFFFLSISFSTSANSIFNNYLFDWIGSAEVFEINNNYEVVKVRLYDVKFHIQKTSFSNDILQSVHYFNKKSKVSHAVETKFISSGESLYFDTVTEKNKVDFWEKNGEHRLFYSWFSFPNRFFEKHIMYRSNNAEGYLTVVEEITVNGQLVEIYRYTLSD